MMLVNKYRIIILMLVLVTVAIVGITLICPYVFRPQSQTSVKDDIIHRIEIVKTHKSTINILAMTPFLWDEGFILDHTISQAAFSDLVGKKVRFQTLEENEQRLIFYYKDQKVADVVITRDELWFDIESRKVGYEGVLLDITREDGQLVLRAVS